MTNLVARFCKKLLLIFKSHIRPHKSSIVYQEAVAIVGPVKGGATPQDDNLQASIKESCVRLVSPLSQEMFQDVAIDVFCEVPVNSVGIEDSNHFLLSLWNEMNIMLHPKHCNYVPWYYRPDIVATDSKWKLIMMGDVQTSFGNFHLMLRMKDKKSIKSILAYNARVRKEDCQQLFEKLVSTAKKNVNTLRTFVSTVRLKCRNCDINTINFYSGDNFYLYSDEKGICIEIRLLSIDYIEAKQQMVKRVDELCYFLSVESNLLFEVDGVIDISESTTKLPKVVNQEFIKPYIDGHSIREDRIKLSESGVKFLNQYIFVDRDSNEGEAIMFFKRSCTHVYEGMRRQLEKGGRIGYVTQTHALVLAPKDNPRNQNTISMAAMSFLSALETASMPEGKSETCPKCGNVTYKISARVDSLVSRYLNPEAGRVFKELYDVRSKFLHAGKLSCENYYITARPFIDPSTGSGLTDYGFISCRVKGKLQIFGVSNIQELATYVLRCYYQENLFNIKDFEPEDDHSKDIDVKQIIINKIQEAMPEGIKVVDVTTL